MSALQINVSDLLSRPRAQKNLVIDEIYTDLVTSTASVVSDQPVHLDVTLERIPDGIVVRGRVIAHWRGECRLCTEPVEADLDLPIGELFELEPVEGETYPIVGLEIDLDQVVRDTVLPELPLAPACTGPAAEGCAGRAAEITASVVNEPDPRWAVLSQLTPEASASPRSN